MQLNWPETGWSATERPRQVQCEGISSVPLGRLGQSLLLDFYSIKTPRAQQLCSRSRLQGERRPKAEEFGAAFWRLNDT